MKDEGKARLLHFILHPSAFILSEAEAVRVERTGAARPGGLAHRCTTIRATPPKRRMKWEGRRMKARLSVFCFVFILHPSAFVLAFGGTCGSRTHLSSQAP